MTSPDTTGYAATLADSCERAGLTKEQMALARWCFAHLSDSEWLNKYRNSKNTASRDVVISALEKLQPFEHIVELGCHNGPMLSRIRDAFPDVELYGVEANEVAIKDCPFPNIFHNDMGDWLRQQNDLAVDVVLTHYALAYVSPEQIETVISHCCRIARKAVVFAEPHGPSELTWIWPEWRHPVDDIVRQFGFKVTTYDVPGTQSAQSRLNSVTVGTR